VLACYFVSAKAYNGMEQYSEALRNCNTILEVEDHYQAHIIMGTAFENL
jgi:hypothetical protein